MNTVQSADGTTIAFTKAGQGPPLILVDGALCSRSFGPMPKLAAQLTPHFTVYTYDRRGRGASGDTPPYAADREVDDIEALITMAGETVFVHGTSSGSALALEAAKRVPAIGKLAVYEPPFIVDGTRSPIPRDYLARLNRLVAPTLPYDITIVQDHQRGTPFPPAEWAAIKVRTLVAAGGKSPAWMANATRALADALPDAQYRTLPGQNHMVKPQAIAPVLTEFFLADN